MMKEDDFSSWCNIGIGVIILIALLIFGCATAPPSLVITEAQVDAKIKALLERPVTSEGVKFDAVNEQYIVDPPTARTLANDEIRLGIYEGEIIPEMERWLAENPPITFLQKLKHFGIGFITGYLLGIGSGVYISQ